MQSNRRYKKLLMLATADQLVSAALQITTDQLKSQK